MFAAIGRAILPVSRVIALALLWVGVVGAQTPPNVLLIAVDDLRPELPCYGDPHVQSPHIDRLAASGRLFQRAYCQQAVCNPSRSSLMTGLRPDTIGVTGNHVHFRSQRPDVVTMSQHFKRHGYHAQSIGKIYHGVFEEGASKTSWDTMGDPPSWSVPTTRFGPRYYYTETGMAQARQSYLSMYRPSNPQPDDWTHKLVFGPMTEAPEVSDDTLYDGQVATAAVAALRELPTTGKPFFLAVGFIKPHSPFVAPKKYWDLYDPSTISLADRTKLPDGAPSLAGHGSGEIRRYTDQPAGGEIPAANQRRMKHGYYACISYIDAQIGRVLDALRTEGLQQDTIVVLFGDHGYHLGEHGLWGKTTNFELDTRVPLIIRVPGMKAPGQATRGLAELVDLYPTLAELAGLPLPSELEGSSLVPLLEAPAASADDVALSQYPRGSSMGYSLRTNEWRYTEWIQADSGRVVARELYDHRSRKPPSAERSIELVNVSDLPQHAALVERLSARLRQEIGFQQKYRDARPGKVVPSAATSFEECPAGPFTAVQSTVGRWTAATGHVEIDKAHRRTGQQCLHMLGGEQRAVELALDTDRPAATLAFHAERWTRRGPFQFRVEQLVDGKEWKEIYNGDTAVKIGGFLTPVSIPLRGPVARLRFVCTSPPGSGILIDDLGLTPPTRQRIVNVVVEPVRVPALIGTDRNPLLRVRVDAEGSLQPISLQSVQAQLSGTVDGGAIAAVQWLAAGNSAVAVESSVRLAEISEKVVGQLQFEVEHTLQPGANHFWLSCRLDKRANIDGRIEAACRRLVFSDGTLLQPKSEAYRHRLGIALRRQGQDQVHTCRIPGLATTGRGTLIGVYDLRRRGSGDLPGDIDVGMSRSIDGGRTWEPMRVIMDMGDDPQWRYDGIGDPAVLVDGQTGTIWVAATWSHGNRSWLGSGPGLQPEETGQLMMVRSDDDGVSWSQPINITRQIKKPEWCFVLQGPGKGITMRDGTLVFAAQYQDPVEQQRLPHSTIIYSQDHGQTWQAGTGAFDDTTEAQVVEIEPGVLMLNCRYNRQPVRVVMTTRDLGATWQKHPTSARSLIEPRACMASLIDVERETKAFRRGKDQTGWLLFSNPDSTSGRHHLTIKASPDLGRTWPKRHRMLLDEGSGRGYSCLTLVDEDTVGILYEGSRSQLTFQRIPLADLIDAARQDSRPEVAEVDEEQLALPLVFGDQMVLQADAPLPVWGRSRPAARITVSLGEETRRTQADAQGNWKVSFASRKASYQPIQLTVESGDEQIQFKDILVGEVWVCAGQSNMEWPLSQSTGAAEELATAERAKLRLLHLPGGARGSSGSYSAAHLARLSPDAFCRGHWQTASAESARSFSAVGWYFARRLQEELGVPVGLICPAVGGSPTEAWIPREAMQQDPELRELVRGNWLDNERLGEFCRTRGEQNLLPAMQRGEAIPGDDLGPHHSFKPGFMWSAGIRPLIPYAIRGVIWYQGESNAESPERVREHERLFRLLVEQWRQHWSQGDFPFLFVQLPAINRPDWPGFREGQRRVLDQLSNVGMAVTIDTGHPSNVHPPRKAPVGRRLAAWALGTTYGQARVYSGPLPQDCRRDGASLVVTFDHVGDGLKSSDGQPPRHFEVAGRDGLFRPAAARIAGRNQLVLSSSQVPKPAYARYAWLPYPEPSVNLFNSAGLPASPFSTIDETRAVQRTDVIRVEQEQEISLDRRPNVLLIVGEDHGCELSCYGDPVIQSPHIDRLAAQGVLFENGYVTQSVCSPSRSTIFTGLYPHQNGQLGLATHQYGWFKHWPTSYSLLKRAGYRTGLIGKTHIIPEDAVEAFVDFRFQPGSNFAKKQVSDYAVRAGEFFRAGEAPFFMTVNYPDAHWPLQGQVDGLPQSRVDPAKVQVMPYVGDETPRLREIVRNYYDCMLRLDACVGQLLAQLDESGKADNTLVIFIGDHGAQMARGKVTVYEGGMRVPYIVRWPGHVAPGQRSRALVSTLDLLPTLTQAAGVEAPAGLPGQALQPLFSGQGTDIFRSYLACERNCDAARHTFPQRTIRDARFKLIYSPVRDREDPAARYYRIHGASHWSGCLTDEELEHASEQTRRGYARWLNPPEIQLFDLAEDPHEWHDLSDEPAHAATRQRLLAALRQWQVETRDPLASSEKLQQLLDENDAVFRAGRRSPAGGWRYLDYLHPDQSAKHKPQLK